MENLLLRLFLPLLPSRAGAAGKMEDRGIVSARVAAAGRGPEGRRRGWRSRGSARRALGRAAQNGGPRAGRPGEAGPGGLRPRVAPVLRPAADSGFSLPCLGSPAAQPGQLRPPLPGRSGGGCGGSGYPRPQPGRGPAAPPLTAPSRRVVSPFPELKIKNKNRWGSLCGTRFSPPSDSFRRLPAAGRSCGGFPLGAIYH